MMRRRAAAFARSGPLPPVEIDPRDESVAALTVGQRAADTVARSIGSWRFLILQSGLLVVWVIANVVWNGRWDPYPFILMNLLLSLQAAYSGPVIMMSQNRMAELDRHEARRDLLTDLQAEEEVRQMIDHLERQDVLLREILVRLDSADAGCPPATPQPTVGP